MSYPGDTKFDSPNAPFLTDSPGQHDLLDYEIRSKRRRRTFRIMTCFLVLAGILFGTELLGQYSPRWFSGSSFVGCPGHRRPHSYPIPPGIKLEECTDWNDLPDSARALNSMSTNITLDDPSNLFFVSRGSLSYGKILITQYDNPSRDSVEVNVAVRNGFQEMSKVCKIIRDDGANGIGIFTPNWDRRRRARGPIFDVKVDLPKSSKKKPLVVQSLETDLPMFRHTLGNIGEHVFFKNLLLSSINEAIETGPLRTEVVNISTVNAGISGRYYTNSSITLKTVNAPISVLLEMINENVTHATTAELYTTNSHIDFTANLTSTQENDGGAFGIVAETARGHIDADIVETPIDSILTLEAQTALARIDARLPTTFQGQFDLETVLSKASLDYKEDVEDPAGKGRKRHLQVDSVKRNQIQGATWWSNENKAKGSAVLKTSMGKVNLHL
ncbi:hypothetical protein CC1G_11130 [Coprinopsis cinerea okayama7|uniref:Uncharacterized protein n=1 Tax=Coprinopsis cinerea (strain Okayama-7 / 130 / ATCC MYA-4618 / FGSC 9003) TaxID=240176 RepID=A8N4R5_COPC7|nr:hypothetical protein CC1G_11130 [Coprinopsis cinerea okayama7\|eukprot:XP_001829860.1 hypothetical protein CC1G_11130 [Coprinopsis cinerea okayama7\